MNDSNMDKSNWVKLHAQRTLDRLLPRVAKRFKSFIKSHPEDWAIFQNRLKENFEKLFTILIHLYKDQYDFFYYLEELLIAITQYWVERPTELKEIDLVRQANPDWYQTHQMVGGVCYVDLFAGNLSGIREKIPYFKELEDQNRAGEMRYGDILHELEVTTEHLRAIITNHIM